jgi:hypothetical protein
MLGGETTGSQCIAGKANFQRVTQSTRQEALSRTVQCLLVNGVSDGFFAWHETQMPWSSSLSETGDGHQSATGDVHTDSPQPTAAAPDARSSHEGPGSGAQSSPRACKQPAIPAEAADACSPATKVMAVEPGDLAES